jgi:hypothetical protein
MMKVGEWKPASSKFIVTDPCYDIQSCAHVYVIINNVVTDSIWHAFVDEEEGRISNLVVLSDTLDRSGTWKMLNKKIGVDSGQAGIFNLVDYPQSRSTGYYGNTSTFYGQCCKSTLSAEQVGIVSYGQYGPIGVVSSSGWGDGSYQVSFRKNNDGKIDGIHINYF